MNMGEETKKGTEFMKDLVYMKTRPGTTTEIYGANEQWDRHRIRYNE